MIAWLLPKTKKTPTTTRYNVDKYENQNSGVLSEMEHMRENKPRFTLAAAYIRH